LCGRKRRRGGGGWGGIEWVAWSDVVVRSVAIAPAPALCSVWRVARNEMVESSVDGKMHCGGGDSGGTIARLFYTRLVQAAVQLLYCTAAVCFGAGLLAAAAA